MRYCFISVTVFTSLIVGTSCGNVLYNITALPSLSGAEITQPTSINNSGEIVGTAYIGANQYLPLLWKNGSVSLLSSPIDPSESAFPSQINSSGSIVGTVEYFNGSPSQAIAWSDEGIEFLPADVATDSTAMAINDTGTIVGEAGANAAARAASWSATLATKSVGLPLGRPSIPSPIPLGSWQATNLGISAGDTSTAVAINNSGTIAGNILRSTGPSTAFILQNGVTTDLGSLGGGYSSAYAMNQSGAVVGVSSLSSGDSHAFIWSDGTMTDLKPLPGQDLSLALGVNDVGEVVGDSDSEFSSIEPVIWIDEVPYNLNDLIAADSGWVLERAVSINDNGDIVGTGYYNGQQAAFLITPDGIVSIPEPAAISLATGFCVLPARRRAKASS